MSTWRDIFRLATTELVMLSSFALLNILPTGLNLAGHIRAI
jgi:hypothetical protein